MKKQQYKIRNYWLVLFLTASLIGCQEQERDKKLIVDAGSFLEDQEAKQLASRLQEIDRKGKYSLFVYTVIAEKYYTHANYDDWVFHVISQGDTIHNHNILLYFAYDEQKIKLKTGKDARRVLSDSLSAQAINRIIPYLSKKEYYRGITEGINYVDSVFAQAKYQ